VRQAVLVEPGRIEIHNVPVPKYGPDEILVRVKRIGVCGSDIHVWHGKHPYTNYPVVQGHEFSGFVGAVGKNVVGIKQGQKVTVRPQIVCGICGPCKRGDYHICDSLKVEGFQASGCAQDYFVTTKDKIIPLPNSLSFEDGALIEPTSVAVHSTAKVTDLTGKNVVVFGAGTIGNLVAQTAKCRGAGKVLITDLSDFRLNIAKVCGIDTTSNVKKQNFNEAARNVFGEKGFAVAFEAVGVETTMANAIENIQKGGTIVVLGVFGEKPRIDMSTVGDRELKLIGTLMYKHEDYLQAVDWIADKKIHTKPLVTKHFEFEDYAKVYEYIEAKGDQTLKVMIRL